MKKAFLLLFMAFALTGCGNNYAMRFPLHSEVSMGNVPKVEALIKSGTSIEMRDEYGFTPLMTAVCYNQWETINALIDMGAAVNAKDPNGTSPLLHAVHGNQPKTALFLIGKGADIEARSNDGLNSLILAASYQYFDIVRILADRGADLNVQDASGMTPLLYAVSYCQPDAVNFLIKSGAQLNVKDKNGLTAFHHLALNCSGSPTEASAIIDNLLDNGCDIAAVDKDGHSAYWKSMEYRITEMVALLRKKGVTERFGGGSPVDLKTMAAEDCTYIVDGERSAGVHSWFIAGPISYGIASLSDSIKIPKKYRACMGKMGFNIIEH